MQHEEGKKIRGLKIYRELAEEYTTHPAQSWRDRALRTVVQSVEEESAIEYNNPGVDEYNPSRNPSRNPSIEHCSKQQRKEGTRVKWPSTRILI